MIIRIAITFLLICCHTASVGCCETVVHSDRVVASCDGSMLDGRVTLVSEYGPGISVRRDFRFNGIECIDAYARHMLPRLPEHLETPHVRTDETISMIRSLSDVIALDPLAATLSAGSSGELLWLGFIGDRHFVANQTSREHSRRGSVCRLIATLPARHGIFLTMVGDNYRYASIDHVIIVRVSSKHDIACQIARAPRDATAEQCVAHLSEWFSQ